MRGKGLVTVDMGPPRLDWRQVPMAQAVDTANFPLDVGRQRACTSAPSPWAIPIACCSWPTRARLLWPQLGSRIETLPFFPNRTNVEFAQVLDRGRIRMRVWERGAGITLACGTGACATAVAADPARA